MKNVIFWASVALMVAAIAAALVMNASAYMAADVPAIFAHAAKIAGYNNDSVIVVVLFSSAVAAYWLHPARK